MLARSLVQEPWLVCPTCRQRWSAHDQPCDCSRPTSACCHSPLIIEYGPAPEPVFTYDVTVLILALVLGSGLTVLSVALWPALRAIWVANLTF